VSCAVEIVRQAAAPSAGMEVRPVDAREAGEIERGVAALARASNGGLIITAIERIKSI